MPAEILLVLGAAAVLVAMGLRGPGIVFVLPFVDKATRLTLDRDISGWRGLSEEQLREAVLQRLNM